MSAEPSAAEYDRAWIRLKGARACALVASLAWLPVNAVASVSGTIPLLGWPWYVVSMGVCTAAFVGGCVVVMLVRCPACAKHFTRTWWWSHPLTGRCLHCGVRQWSLPAATGPERGRVSE
jgi:hypothetical protein